MSTNYILKKIDTASFQHHNSYQKQYAKKNKKRQKIKLCISPKKNGEKQGELLIKLNATIWRKNETKRVMWIVCEWENKYAMLQ